jgi:hypothetical protein
MIDTHWLQSPKLVEVSYNDTTAALFELYDIRQALPHSVRNKPIDADSDFTIDEALNSVIEFLEALDQKCTEIAP